MRVDVICHFEDEPGRIDLPVLLEAALYAFPEVSESSIEISAKRDLYVIDFIFRGTPSRIAYAVAMSVAEMQDRINPLGSSVERAMLHIVDLSIEGKPYAGVGIFDELLRRGVNSDNVWFMTAYASDALREASSRGQVRVIAKPCDALSIVDDLLERIFGSASK